MKAPKQIVQAVFGILVIVVFLSGCGCDPTPSEPAVIDLGIASVANKGESGLAQASGSSWDRVAFSWTEIQMGPDEDDWHWQSAEAALSNEPMENVLVVLTGHPKPFDPWHNRPAEEGGYLPAPMDIDPECARDVLEGNRPDDHYCVRFTGLEQDVWKSNGEINPGNTWAYFVHEATSRYADRVDAWQIYNEVFGWTIASDYDFSTGGTTDSVEYWIDPAHYLDAVEVAYEVIKAGPNGNDGTDPDAYLVLGSPIEAHMWVILGEEGAFWTELWKQEWYRKVLLLLEDSKADVASHQQFPF
jgi:hypothetical protein